MDPSRRNDSPQISFFGNDAPENIVSKHIVTAAIEVHKTLGGPGLLESVYQEALFYELTQMGILVEKEINVPINYKGALLASPLRVDLLVAKVVIVECKAVNQYNPIYESQALTYLRLTRLRLALVINFGERLVKNGIHRVINPI